MNLVEVVRVDRRDERACDNARVWHGRGRRAIRRDLGHSSCCRHRPHRFRTSSSDCPTGPNPPCCRHSPVARSSAPPAARRRPLRACTPTGAPRSLGRCLGGGSTAAGSSLRRGATKGDPREEGSCGRAAGGSAAPVRVFPFPTAYLKERESGGEASAAEGSRRQRGLNPP